MNKKKRYVWHPPTWMQATAVIIAVIVVAGFITGLVDPYGL
ncbi:hypothetical protein [Aminicella lysinilytica]|uniref:Uncharacterized protein n=1 Tax=Aminicella lysinilytica TaxID=433323 RepID=A0A4R6QB01_9FIRM|nr:hypothetical protein [Aminicella lysinilytica]TDP59818.1 hypothetical protein EV211_10260 [Aminicella lysinilytica]